MKESIAEKVHTELVKRIFHAQVKAEVKSYEELKLSTLDCTEQIKQALCPRLSVHSDFVKKENPSKNVSSSC